jgi:hypothetical protein
MEELCYNVFCHLFLAVKLVIGHMYEYVLEYIGIIYMFPYALSR